MRADPIRANQIRFNKGQSKAIRNCILHAMPRALVLQALQAARKGVSARMDAFIKAKGLAAAQHYTVSQLKGLGVDEGAILAKVGKEKVTDLTLEDLVGLAADYKAIDNGDANASELFTLKEAKSGPAAADLKDKLRATVEASAQKPAEPAQKPSGGVVVRLGPEGEPFTWLVHDGVALLCSCGAKKGPCPHVSAVEHFNKGYPS